MIPAFVSDPDFCQIEYSFTISDALVENALTFDPETHTFYFFEPSDLLVSGDNFNEYTVTVIGTVGLVDQVQD